MATNTVGVAGGITVLPDYNFLHGNRRTIRQAVNPFDKSTVISIYPRSYLHKQPTCQPASINIKEGSPSNPSLTIVEPASWWREVDDAQPLLEIVSSSVQVATAIVNDFCNGLWGCNMDSAMPGIAWVPGVVTPKDLKEGIYKFNDQEVDLRALMTKLEARQKNYWKALVDVADVGWARTNGNPLAIGDESRMAAQQLNLVNKEWLIDKFAVELTRCLACGHLGNPEFPVCSNCKAIRDKKKAEELGIVFAKVG